jgi:hypothetical protein
MGAKVQIIFENGKNNHGIVAVAVGERLPIISIGLRKKSIIGISAFGRRFLETNHKDSKSCRILQLLGEFFHPSPRPLLEKRHFSGRETALLGQRSAVSLKETDWGLVQVDLEVLH